MPQKIAEVSYFNIPPDSDGQRLDNWLLKQLKGLPRSRVYRIIRSGEVRVNKGRAKASQRLKAGDQVRVPPMRLDAPAAAAKPSDSVLSALSGAVLYRDKDILVLNKPAGLPVHAGSGLRYGVIDAARHLWGEDWQLVHRLDRPTSGCLLLVRRRELQVEFQKLQEEGAVKKDYQALVHGDWRADQLRLSTRMERATDANGQGRVRQDEEGKLAVSVFHTQQRLPGTSLMGVRIETGRTHQIRVQCAGQGHPIVGDDKYGSRDLDRGLGLARRPPLCLHAERLELVLGGRDLRLKAPLPAAFLSLLGELKPRPADH